MAFIKLIEKKRKMNLKPNTLLYVYNPDAFHNEMALKGEVIKIHFQRLYDPIPCFLLYIEDLFMKFSMFLPLKLLRKISSNQIGIIFFVRCFVSNSLPSTLVYSCNFFFIQIEFLLRFVTDCVALYDSGGMGL